MPLGQHWPTTNAALLGQLRNPRDTRGWRDFVDLYLPLIYEYSRRRGLQDADAQNVVQEVLMLVTQAIRSFEYDPEYGRFRNWLGCITHQRIIRYLGKEQGASRGLGDGAGDELCESVPYEVDGEWIETFHAHLYRRARERIRPEFDDDTWHVFEQVWECDRRPNEVAVQMERKPEWVYQAKFQVLRRFKQEVSRLSADEIIFFRQR